MQKINNVLIWCVITLFIHRIFFTEGILSYIPFLFVILSFALNLVILLSGKVNKKIGLNILIPLVSGFIVILNILIDIPYAFIILGYGTVFFFGVYWALVLYNMNKIQTMQFIGKINSLIIWNCVVVGLVGIYQYYIDFSIFGLNRHIHYGDYERIYYEVYTKRVTSTVGSPQNCGLILYIGFIVGLFTIENKKLKYAYLILIFFTGILSGSGAFIGIMIISLLFTNFSEMSPALSYYIKITLFILMLLFAFKPFNLGLNGAIEGSFNISPESHLPYYSKYIESTDLSIFGRGLGTSDRLTMKYVIIDSSNLWIPEPESHLLKLASEIGIFTLVIIAFNLISIIQTRRHNKQKYIDYLCIGILANVIFTPAVSGFTGSMVYWLFYSLSYSKNKIR
jgi:hypothetical protein